MKTPSLSRRTALGLLAGGVAAPSLARAEDARRWRMVTSWPRNMIGPGISARRICDRIAAMSAGRLRIDVFAAGEIVPAFGVFDAVSTGVVEIGHSASFFWAGKMPAATVFTALPFGLGPIEHLAWIDTGGQALWEELYAPAKVKPKLGGNTGPCMGGWFRKEIRSVADLKGLRLRVQGLGSSVYAQLGATPLSVSPGDIQTSLLSGALDAVEFLNPANDLPLGLNRAAPFYYAPGFNKPNGASEMLIGLDAWNSLSEDLQSIVDAACRAEYAAGLADAEHLNAVALVALEREKTSKVVVFPEDLLNAAREAAHGVLETLGRSSPLAGRILDSYQAAQAEGKNWSRLSSEMKSLLG